MASFNGLFIIMIILIECITANNMTQEKYISGGEHNTSEPYDYLNFINCIKVLALVYGLILSYILTVLDIYVCQFSISQTLYHKLKKIQQAVQIMMKGV